MSLSCGRLAEFRGYAVIRAGDSLIPSVVGLKQALAELLNEVDSLRENRQVPVEALREARDTMGGPGDGQRDAS